MGNSAGHPFNGNRLDVRFLDAGKKDQAIFTALERRQGVEKEQWLVWGPLFAPAPDVDAGEAGEEVLVGGLVGSSCHGSIMAVLGWDEWMAIDFHKMAAAHAPGYKNVAASRLFG